MLTPFLALISSVAALAALHFPLTASQVNAQALQLSGCLSDGGPPFSVMDTYKNDKHPAVVFGRVLGGKANVYVVLYSQVKKHAAGKPPADAFGKEQLGAERYNARIWVQGNAVGAAIVATCLDAWATPSTGGGGGGGGGGGTPQAGPYDGLWDATATSNGPVAFTVPSFGFRVTDGQLSDGGTPHNVAIPASGVVDLVFDPFVGPYVNGHHASVDNCTGTAQFTKSGTASATLTCHAVDLDVNGNVVTEATEPVTWTATRRS